MTDRGSEPSFLFMQLEAGALALDRDGRITQVNEALARRMGRPRQEMEGADWFELALDPAIREQVRAVFADLMAGRSRPVTFYENEVLHADGGRIHLAWHNCLLRDEDGRITGTFSLAEDVADRPLQLEQEVEARADQRAGELRRVNAHLAEALARREAAEADLELYRRLFEHSPTAMYLVRLPDPADLGSFTIVAANARSRGPLGGPPDQRLGRPLREWGQGLVDLGLAASCAEALRLDQPVDLGEYLVPAGAIAGSPEAWYQTWAFPLGGELLGVVSEDITARKQATAAGRAQTQFLEAILENIPDMVFVKDAQELRFVRLNRAGEELVGRSREELFGHNDTDFFPPDEAAFFIAKDREVLQSGMLLDIPEEPIHTATRGTRLLHTKKIPVLDDDGTPLYLLGISEDITERRRAERTLARKAEQLVQSNQDLEQFAYVASHDLQEPLRKIRAFGDLLESAAGTSLDEEARDYLKRMQRAATRMQDLVEDLLHLSRVSSRATVAVPVDLGECLSVALGDLELRRAEVGAVIESDPLPTVTADRSQMVQLFANIIGNALKFRAEDRPCVIRIHARRARADSVELIIEDNGIGFRPEEATRIFQPFQRLHGRDRYQGTGMGLAICRRIVERHGGEIMAEGRPDQGARFRIQLPVDGPIQPQEAR